MPFVKMCMLALQGKTNGVAPEVTKKTKAAQKVSIEIISLIGFDYIICIMQYLCEPYLLTS